ncbi:MAG: hypothetical protein HWD60_18900 [Defluviicoccus sp.]|nr:MAG: hypothetical protein HWD60_18900 [Defluviicoccus sp.]
MQVVYANAGDARNHGQWGAVMPPTCAGRVRVDPGHPVGGVERSAKVDTRPDTAVHVNFDLPVSGWWDSSS